MALTEMVQCHPPMSYGGTNTTNTLSDSLVEWPIVMLSDEQATEMALAVSTMKMTSPSAPPSLAAETATTTPGFLTPCLACSAKAATLVVGEFNQQFMEVEALKSAAPAKPITLQDLEYLIIKLISKGAEDNAEVSDSPKLVSPDDTRSKEVVARASLLAFKEVDEIWDDKAYKYTVVESPKPKEIGNLDQYVFVVRRRVDKKSKETTHFVDVKSFMLRDALRRVLRDVPRISIIEEQLSIERNILYSFLPKIELCRD